MRNHPGHSLGQLKMDPTFPPTAGEFLTRAEAFRLQLQSLKRSLTVPDYGWYPYDSLSSLSIITKLIEPVFDEVAARIASGPVADIGCADGDLALLLASLGAQVDAIDHRESSYNQMRGIDLLRQALNLPVCVHDLDLDKPTRFPRQDYKFAFFLGTLYHLKNPFLVMEKLASCADWCLLSTRVARTTPRHIAIEEEPLAYLLDAREANDDPTNFWIFSGAGLLRLLSRTHWTVVSQQRLGNTISSDPIRGDADERMFVLLKSVPRHPELQVRPLYGWYAVENDEWRWTAKNFGLEVVLPEQGSLSEFALQIDVPAALLCTDPVRLTCTIDEKPAGAITCRRPELVEFRGRFPKPAAARVLRLDFSVESSYSPGAGDLRDLGVVIPLAESSPGNPQRIPFRVS
jgi:SAM-dependent methyltransferase